MSSTILHICPATEFYLKQYAEVAKSLDYEIDVAPDGYILIADQDENFIAGVGVHDTNGRFILFEDAVARPGLKRDVLLAATDLMIAEIVSQSLRLNKNPVCLVLSVGIKNALKRFGFESEPTWVCRRPSGEPIPREVVESVQKRLVKDDNSDTPEDIRGNQGGVYVDYAGTPSRIPESTGKV